MRARSLIAVERHGHRDRLVDVRCEPPLTVRECHDRILLVGSAAAPVGGDDLRTEVRVGPGATARIGSAAATLIWPAPTTTDGMARPSSSITHAIVDDGGCLEWHPEPMVSLVGSVHRAATVVELAEVARCSIVEELALGRHGEPAGQLELTLRVRRAGRALIAHSERFGPHAHGAGSVVSIGEARHVICVVLVGPTAFGVVPSAHVVEPAMRAAAALPIAPDAVVVMAVGGDRADAWAAVDEVAPGLCDRFDSMV
ncbi:MAG: urease accessory protein UreD [Actinomycetota bacterium]